MKQAEQDLLKIIKSALFQGALEPLEEDTDFAALFAEAKVQCVYPIAYDCLGKAGVEIRPAAVKEQWSQSVYRQLYRNNRLQIAQREVVTLLEQAGIPCVILKGTSAAACYPEPSLRVLGDIDILVKPEQQMDAVKCLQEIGYGEILQEDHHCHFTIRRNGIAVEVHKEPNGLHFNKNDAIARQIGEFFADALQRRQIIDGIPVLADDQQAVVLIMHKLEHFLSGGLGLRQLSDWAVFADKRLTLELWDKLRPLLEACGLLYFTELVTQACVTYLGLPSAHLSWKPSADEALVDEVMEHILACGNFGQKGHAYGERFFIDPHSANRITSFFKMVAIASRQHWPVCQRHPILMPIAPFVIYAKYLRLRRKGEREALQPLKLYKSTGAKQRLYRDIKPFVSGK